MYQLATIQSESGPNAAIVSDGWVGELTEISEHSGLASGSLLDVIRQMEDIDPILAKLASCPDWRSESRKGVQRIGKAIFLAPVQYPSKLVCAQANYFDHLREMGIDDYDKTAHRATFFLRPPTTTVVGPGDTVIIPNLSRQFDWELELVAIIGRTTKNVSVDDALDSVAAYTIGLDLTSRDLQIQPDSAFRYDFFAGKCSDNTCPMGPFIVPSGFVENHQSLGMELRVNGVVEQSSNTSNMIYSVQELVSSISEIVTLEAGDMIMTGTPAGVGHAKGKYLSSGDTINGSIDQLGTLTVTARRQ